jgi:glycosyltransferase involved in cell wall biosynthesis
VIRAVGVVVPAHDEEDLLPLCLASLREAAQALCGAEVHLVVVADACRDLTGQVARRGGASVVAVEARNVGTARAAGVREVLHRTRHLDLADVWVATTDADSVVRACWLRQQARYAGQGWGPVAGTIEVTDWSGYRREARAPHGFSHYLAELDGAQA